MRIYYDKTDYELPMDRPFMFYRPKGTNQPSGVAVEGKSPSQPPKLLDTPSFAASTLRTIATWIEVQWIEGATGTDEWAQFLNRLADELEGQ